MEFIGFKKIDNQALLQRLLSFGFFKGARLKILQYGYLDATIKIELETSCIALRESEARFLEVKLIEL